MSRCPLPCALVLALAAPWALQAQPGAAPVQPARPPEWVQGITRMAFGSPGEVEKVAAAGAQVLHTNLVWPWAGTDHLYPGRSAGRWARGRRSTWPRG
jgi:hypothetical protein